MLFCTGVCTKGDSTSNGTTLSISISFLLAVIIAIITVLAIITGILIRERFKLKAKLERVRANQIYEEIDSISQIATNTTVTKNVAYSGVNESN